MQIWVILCLFGYSSLRIGVIQGSMNTFIMVGSMTLQCRGLNWIFVMVHSSKVNSKLNQIFIAVNTSQLKWILN